MGQVPLSRSSVCSRQWICPCTPQTSIAFPQHLPVRSRAFLPRCVCRAIQAGEWSAEYLRRSEARTPKTLRRRPGPGFWQATLLSALCGRLSARTTPGPERVAVAPRRRRASRTPHERQEERSRLKTRVASVGNAAPGDTRRQGPGSSAPWQSAGAGLLPGARGQRPPRLRAWGTRAVN